MADEKTELDREPGPLPEEPAVEELTGATIPDAPAGEPDAEGAQEAPEEDEKKKKEKSSPKQDLFSWTQALVSVLVGLVLVFTLFGRAIRVVGSSMVPTLTDGDLLLLQSVGYTPQQGDIVVLRKETFMDYPIVKRVIATGGQHVTVDYTQGTVTVDNVVLDEPYINEVMVDTGSFGMTELDVTVPEGSIYVLGDNRNHSSDSRHYLLGTVDERYVLGKALLVVFPFQHFGSVS